MTVNEKLQEVMDWKGVKQEQLHELTGIARSTIGGYTSGRRAISVEVAYQLAAALGVSSWTLLNGEPLPATPDDLTGEETALVTDLRGLTLEQKEVVLNVVATMKKQNKR